MKYKLILCDFDDTLLSSKDEVSKENLQAIREFEKQGGKFVVCTGRMFSSIKLWAEKLGLNGIIGAYLGGYIVDLKSGDVLRQTLMNTNDVSTQIAELKKRGIHVHLYVDDMLHVEERNEMVEQYEKLCCIKAKVTHMPLEEYAKIHSLKAHKILGAGEPKLIFETRTELEKTYPHLVYAISKPHFIEISDKLSTKGEALKFLSNMLNVPISQIASIGDSLNDREMIQEAGMGVAVANASEDLKKYADMVLKHTNDESAIAEFIYNYALV